MSKTTKIIIGVIIALIIVVIGISMSISQKDKVIVSEKETVRVGILAPLTGVRADAGEFMQNALFIAQEDIGSDREKKYRLQLIYTDTQYAPQPSVSGIQKLVEIDKVGYIIGPYGSSQVLAAAPVAEKSKVILITPGGQADSISEAGDYIFRLIHNSSQEAPIFADFISKKMVGDTIHFLAINNAFAPSYLEHLTPNLEKAGKKIGLTEKFDPSETDFRTQLQKIKSQNPTDIFPIATPKQMGLILQQASDLKIKTNFYHIGVEGPELVEIAGELAEGIYYPYSFDSQSADGSIRIFYDKYFDKYGHEPDTVAANTYDAALLISNCLELNGNDTELVKSCLYDTENYKGASGVFTVDEKGDAIKEIIIKTIKDGKFVRIPQE